MLRRAVAIGSSARGDEILRTLAREASRGVDAGLAALSQRRTHAALVIAGATLVADRVVVPRFGNRTLAGRPNSGGGKVVAANAALAGCAIVASKAPRVKAGLALFSARVIRIVVPEVIGRAGAIIVRSGGALVAAANTALAGCAIRAGETRI